MGEKSKRQSVCHRAEDDTWSLDLEKERRWDSLQLPASLASIFTFLMTWIVAGIHSVFLVFLPQLRTQQDEKFFYLLLVNVSICNYT